MASQDSKVDPDKKQQDQEAQAGAKPGLRSHAMLDRNAKQNSTMEHVSERPPIESGQPVFRSNVARGIPAARSTDSRVTVPAVRSRAPTHLAGGQEEVAGGVVEGMPFVVGPLCRI